MTALPPERTLEAKVVVVTRPRKQAAELISLLRDRGAVPLAVPAIRLVRGPAGALDEALDGAVAGSFRWVVFTSAAGVEALLARLGECGLATDALRASVATVGEGTAAALRAVGVEPDLVPATFTTAALARAFPRGRGRVLLARADIATGELESALERKGWTPVRVDAYRTRPVTRLPAAAGRALANGWVDALTFTSASTVEGFARMLEGGDVRLPSPGPKVVCIGPVTARAAAERGLPVAAIARPHTIEGLVRALERAFQVRRSRGRI